MKKHEGQKQWNLSILRLVGLVLVIATCYTIFVATPIGGKVDVAALSTSRTTAVAHMRLMGTTKWVPSSTWYNTAKSGRKDDYIKGYVYKGMPYSQNNGGSTKEYWSHFNAKLTYILYPYVDVFNCNVTAGLSSDAPDEFGNDCAKAVFQSWQKAGSGINPNNYNTDSMLNAVKTSQNYMKKLGNYSTAGNTSDMTDTAVKAEKVKEAYKLLQPGDCLFYSYPGNGHAIMVTSVNVSAGTVSYIDQIGSGGVNEYHSVAGWRLDETYSTWRVGFYRFSDLIINHYVPVTCTLFR